MSYELVWFKRDLRIADHEPLVQASRRGAVLALYGDEPSVIGSPEFDSCHLRFINECLDELRTSLARRARNMRDAAWRT